MEGLMWAVPDQDLSCGASEMVADASGEQARGRGSLSSWEVEGALQLSHIFSGLCMWSLLDNRWSTSQQGYQVLAAIVVSRDEVEVSISLSPLSGNSFTFTKFYWSSSYRTQIREEGHQSHLVMGELSKNWETMFYNNIPFFRLAVRNVPLMLLQIASLLKDYAF